MSSETTTPSRSPARCQNGGGSVNRTSAAASGSTASGSWRQLKPGALTRRLRDGEFLRLVEVAVLMVFWDCL